MAGPHVSSVGAKLLNADQERERQIFVTRGEDGQGTSDSSESSSEEEESHTNKNRSLHPEEDSRGSPRNRYKRNDHKDRVNPRDTGSLKHQDQGEQEDGVDLQPTPLLPRGKTGRHEDAVVAEEGGVVSGSGCCQRVKACCSKVTAPFEAKNHPLPSNPTRLDKLKHAFFCPPSGGVGAVLFVVAVFFLWWGVLISITKEKALPGGVIFPMLMMFIGCWCGSYLINLSKLPPLFGMLLVGGILGNVPVIDVGRQIDPEWSSTARYIALTVILTRAGLGLSPAALKKLSWVVLRLAFCPSLVEAAVDGVAVHYILGLPWDWAYCVAFVLAVVSPSVIVPSMLSLAERGYGLDKGIPTLVVAAVSLDAVLAITGVGVMLGVIFTSGSIAWTLIKGPLQVIVGIVVGCVMGIVLWYIPQKSSQHLLLFRSAMLFGTGLLSIFGSKYVGWSGSGPLACITVPLIAGYGWKKELAQGEKDPVEEVMGVLWMLVKPLLFGLIGAKVDLSRIDLQTVGLGIAILFIGVAFRLVVAYLTMLGTDLNTKERIFIPLAWTPKATVQAAVGGIALDMAVELKAQPHVIEMGRKVLTLAVLAILIMAPVGALLIALMGPRLLHKTEPEEENQGQARETREAESDDATDPV